MGVQTLRDWVLRYHAAGVEGIRSVRTGGRTALLKEAQMAELRALTVKAPNPETDKVVRWRCIDLREGVSRPARIEVAFLMLYLAHKNLWSGNAARGWSC